jgi:hydrogenase maturation protease
MYLVFDALPETEPREELNRCQMKRQPICSGSGTRVDGRPRIVVIGLGNAYRGDDAVGLILARRIAARAIPGVGVRIEMSGLDVLKTWQGADVAIIIDAMDLGEQRAGRICRFEYPHNFFSEDILVTSTHSLSFSGVVELANILNQLPPRLIVYGIAGERFTMGTGLSPALNRKVDDALRRIVEEIGSLCREPLKAGAKQNDS